MTWRECESEKVDRRGREKPGRGGDLDIEENKRLVREKYDGVVDRKVRSDRLIAAAAAVVVAAMVCGYGDLKMGVKKGLWIEIDVLYVCMYVLTFSILG